MAESQFWSTVRRGIPEFVNFTRIEVINPPGIPDLYWNVQGENKTGWIELKDEELLLRPEQRILGKKWRSQGINIWTWGRQGGNLFVVDPRAVPLNCRIPTADATPGLGSSPISVIPMPIGRVAWLDVWSFTMGFQHA